jgi:hypothetical protein
MTTRFTPRFRVLHAVLFVLILFILYCHFSIHIIGVDAGLHMYGGLLISKGLLPYENLWNNKPSLIYLIGSIGFIIKSNPFIGIRFLEIALFLFNLLLLKRIIRLTAIKNDLVYLICYCIIYLLCWDGGFLTETFAIPLTLLSLYLFLKRIRYFEILAVVFFVLGFLLKQNAMIVIASIIVFDFFSNYRTANRLRKFTWYGMSLVMLFLVCFFILKSFGILDEFIDQVFVYNTIHIKHPSLLKAVSRHLKGNSFLSIKGISLVMIFNISIFVTLWQYWKKYRSGTALNFSDHFLIGCIVSYLVCYPFVYISARTDAHYFMLLIVPATFIMGYYVNETRMGKLAIILLGIVGISMNVKRVSYYRKVYDTMTEAADYMKIHSNKNDYVLVAGFGHQYLHIAADRLSPTRFVMPLAEENGYTESYKQVIAKDLKTKSPLFIVRLKNNYKALNSKDFYNETIIEKLKSYHPVFQNNLYEIFQENDSLPVLKLH